MNDQPSRQSVTETMANRAGMTRENFERVLRATVFPKEGSPEQFAAFLLVAKQYNLNPITREIHAFPTRTGGIQPVVGIDGWLQIINSHPQMNGLAFEDHIDDIGKLSAITARIFRKDRQHPIEVTEYLAECQRPTEPWKQWPARMLRHKAVIQCARYAFGFSGIVEPDEYERMTEPTPLPPLPKRQTKKAAVEQFKASQADAVIDSVNPETGEIAEPVSPQWDDATNATVEGMEYEMERMCATAEDLDQWEESHRKAMQGLPEAARNRVARVLDERRAELGP